MNAESICGFLHVALQPHELSSSSSLPIAEIFYSKWQTTAYYTARQQCPSSSGFGGLFLLAFVGQRAAEAFYDVLACTKGPSLGTNFTLAYPYTILMHYDKLNWAAQYGVPTSLMCISIRLEDAGWLHKVFANALKVVEDAHCAKTDAEA